MVLTLLSALAVEAFEEPFVEAELGLTRPNRRRQEELETLLVLPAPAEGSSEFSAGGVGSSQARTAWFGTRRSRAQSLP